MSLRNLWDGIVKRLGSVGKFLGIIAQELHVNLKAGDVAKTKATTAKLREKAVEVLELCDLADKSVEDGVLTADEIAAASLKIEDMVD